MQRYYAESNNKAYILLYTINEALLAITTINIKVDLFTEIISILQCTSANTVQADTLLCVT